MNISELTQLPVTLFVGYLAAFLVALLFIVFIHEYGHYKVARLCGIKVEAFSIGFGKEIFGWFDRHGTRWKLSWIPLGGYVKFEGDANAASLPDGSDEAIAARGPDNFHNKPVWQRAAVVAAGPLANFALAIVIFTTFFMFVGIAAIPPRVDGIKPGSAAESAGIVAGDYIREIDGKKITYFGDLQMAIQTRAGDELVVVIERGGTLIPLKLTPTSQEIDNGQGGKVKIGLLGVTHEGTDDAIEYTRYSLPDAFLLGVDRTWYIITTTLKYIGKIFTGKESADQLGGPLAIAHGAGAAASGGFLQFASFIALLSVSVGLINLFPVPMLDGGHLVFYALEAVRGKPIGPRAQEWSFRIGLSFVMMLMVVGSFNDVLRYIIN